MIKVENLCKSYETSEIITHAVQDVSLEIGRGEFVSIQGTSGSGKSTLLHLFGLLDSPSAGEYIFEGVSVGVLNASQRALVRARRIGFIFQSFNLLGDASVLQNVMLPMNFTGDKLSKSEMADRASACLARVGLEARIRHHPHQLSGGQQQRVAIARALVNDPAVLLADEPTGNLDSKTGLAVMDLIKSLHADGTTVVMVTHDPKHARNAARQVQMQDGRVTYDSATSACEPVQ